MVGLPMAYEPLVTLGLDGEMLRVAAVSAVMSAALVMVAAWVLVDRKVARATRDLRRQLARQRAEQDDVERTNTELEARVEARTRELARSNRELERFAYVASHDLREPLRTVTSYTQLLARRYGDKLDAQGKEFIDFAVEGCERMRQLIYDLLEYSRVGRGTDARELVPASAALERVKRNLAAAITECGVTIEHERLPIVRCKPGELEMLFQNLLGNAITYRSQKPLQIRISAYEDDDEVVISVSDNGIGFDTKYAERIFGMFQRLHSRGTYPGTGMGLAICDKIMQSQGGRIWAHSVPGQGATFFCAFPRDGEVGWT